MAERAERAAAGQGPGAVKVPDPVQLARSMQQIAERSQRLMTRLAERPNDGQTLLDPLNISNAFAEMAARMMADPAKLAQAQMRLWSDYSALWQQSMRRMWGEPAEPVAAPAKGDKRFADPSWQEIPAFDFLKQSYLLAARWLLTTVQDVEGLDDKTAQKVEFYTRQFVDAMSPTNFPLTNPEVLRATMESGGENLVKGLDNLLDDLERGGGKLNIRMTDLAAFKVGENIALTPGKVVYQNDLMQLIQYEPATDKVFKRPLLIIPPWINKYYILDLRPKNSFIKWAVEQGHTVFIISWVNPDERLARKSFGDYMREGALAALDAIEQATGERQANVIGYCLGGTLLACTLAWLKAKGEEDRVVSATYLTALVDFENAGDLSVFIDEDQLRWLEAQMSEKGYLDASAMATTFNMLRANDLIWSFVVNNYLLGKDPFPFDLLYWNSDSTRMPAAMHSFYLRNMYQKNKLVEPGGITLDGVPIDLTTIETPTFMLSTREDHIAPWKATYKATQIYRGPVTFCLAASGHIAGVVNPPAAEKYAHWVGPDTPADPEAWLARAEERPGSWWPEWAKWVARHGGRKVPARAVGAGGLKPIEDAPGSYVTAKAD